MRVVAGTLKGRSIKAVKGTNTRPTTDKVKESIFDLFGGSGNLGIESLSRGIDKVIFVDRETIAINTIKENVKDLRIEDCVEIYRNDYFRALKALVKRDIQFDLILLDPPYKGQKINEIIEFVNEHNLLASGGIIMAE